MKLVIPGLALFACLVGMKGAGAAEKWADARLPVTDGLDVWLDATTVAAASEANGNSPPRAGAAVAVWYDGSGNRRDARQDAPGRRPQFRLDLAKPQAAVVQFDGRDDTVVAQVTGTDLRDFTVFVVGAPFSNAGLFRAFFAVNERGQNDYTTGINVDLGPGGELSSARSTSRAGGSRAPRTC